MKPCRLMSTAAMSAQGGFSQVTIRCETHAFTILGIYSEPVTACPIGRIEEAAEAAIARIHEAAKQ